MSVSVRPAVVEACRVHLKKVLSRCVEGFLFSNGLQIQRVHRMERSCENQMPRHGQLSDFVQIGHGHRRALVGLV